MTTEEIKQIVIQWNNRFPLDHWWREKHKEPFMSAKHRESTFFAQRFEFEEDKLFKEFREREKSTYVPNIGEFLKPIQSEDYSEEERLELLKREALDELENITKELNG